MELMNDRYYFTPYVMKLFNIKENNYTTFKNICTALKLPRIKIGKQLFFPKKRFDARLEVIEEQKLKNFSIRQ
jgi:hypothetical protein